MRYRHLDINLLLALDVLLREKSVTAAASRLHMTQPGVSNALSRLRTHFDDLLLVRVGNEMKLSPIAEAMRPELADILQRLNTFCNQQKFDPAKSKRSITIIIEEHIPTELVAMFTAEISTEAPGVNLRFLTSRDDAKERILRGDADMIIASERLVVKGLPSLPLYRDHFICITGIDHSFSGSAASLDEYLARQHVKLFHGDHNVDILKAIGIDRVIATMVPNLATLIEVVKHTSHIATVLKSAVQPAIQAGEILSHTPPLELPSLTISVQWHHRASNDPLINWLGKALAHATTLLPQGTLDRAEPGSYIETSPASVLSKGQSQKEERRG